MTSSTHALREDVSQRRSNPRKSFVHGASLSHSWQTSATPHLFGLVAEFAPGTAFIFTHARPTLAEQEQRQNKSVHLSIRTRWLQRVKGKLDAQIHENHIVNLVSAA